LAKKLNLKDIEVKSFITELDAINTLGGRLAGAVVIAPGETLDENPCTFDTMRDCR